MQAHNRNIIIAVIAAALLLCCCVTACSLAFPIYSVFNRAVVPQLATVQPVPATPHGLGATVPPLPLDKATPAVTRPATPIPSLTRTSSGAALASDAAAKFAQVMVDMPPRDLRELALRLKPNVGDIPVVVNAVPPVYKVGDSAEFWVSNNDTMEHRKITAKLKYVTDHVYMWVEDGVNLSLSDLKKSADRFENDTYPTNREFFGSEWTPGVDDDVHLTILHALGLGDNVAGYYSSADEFSRLVNPYSNQREMFYVSAEARSAKPNSSYYDGTLAHEFQHMIHWNNDRNEDSWVNEGMSELAGHLNGFDAGGHDIAYSEQPDTQLTTWSDPSEGNAAHYGASYLFMSYFLDRFGEDLTKAVVASPENGISGFNEALRAAGRPERFDDVFADWLVANYVDNTSVEDGRYGYKTIDPYPPVATETYRRYPASASSQVSQYAADYFKLAGQGTVTIDFEGQQQVRLVDAEPRGTYSWWSNRGDDADATLTRAFDLENTKAPKLTFSTWYDIEDGWDYLYVEVSEDGGEHWEILPGEYTTDSNPAGNAFGSGWTGISGGGQSPTWVDEEVDLTPYAGKKVLLRFEYVTDDAVNRPGVLLDNMAISEIGYRDDAENGPAGWDAAGWVLTDNTLPQRWLVQLVETGRNGVTVQRMEVGEDGRGQLTSHALQDAQDVVLIVSGLTPVTTERASYSYTIDQR
jgi:immune inhibitor A